MEHRQKKKTALITGGSSGIGLAIARTLRQRDWNVIIFDIQAPPEEFPYFPVNIREEAQIQAALSQIPTVELLVNNAGIYFEKFLEDTADEEIDAMVDINIKGTYRMTRNTLPKIRETKGSIVIIASCLGLVPEPSSPLYCTTKAGLIMLTKCLAQQYAREGIRVNAILPGPIDTPLLRRSFEEIRHNAEKERNSDFTDPALYCADRIPLKRLGNPEDIASMAAFLASPEASFITGGIFPVDGGISSGSIYSTR